MLIIRMCSAKLHPPLLPMGGLALWLISSVSGLTLPIVWQLNNFYTGKAGFATKVNVTVKVSCWVLHAQETE